MPSFLSRIHLCRCLLSLVFLPYRDLPSHIAEPQSSSDCRPPSHTLRSIHISPYNYKCEISSFQRRASRLTSALQPYLCSTMRCMCCPSTTSTFRTSTVVPVTNVAQNCHSSISGQGGTFTLRKRLRSASSCLRSQCVRMICSTPPCVSSYASRSPAQVLGEICLEHQYTFRLARVVLQEARW